VTDDPASGWIPGVHAAGLRALAYAPIVHGGQILGVVVLGTFGEAYVHTLVEQMPGIVSFSATSSALLGERMHARREERKRHDALEDAITARAFHPVFQSIVDLETGETMGYEALTRFDSGQRPDLCFADAWSAGLGPELELATLEAAVAAGKELPAGTWLDLNASPRLLADPRREILWSADRALVLEITEHELIGDYDALRAAVRELGRDIRLAVDDAGAGVANFGHIIDLRPDFVKLDISLVRRVNANIGRQAMVVGMRHFSRTAGCRLIAEGIETEDEARTLRALGVEFGQGYLYGHPGPAADWTAARAAASEPGQLALPHAPDGPPAGDRG
jgi:EAL domain-containing protein (putative c-di-GMP-specific phosphodiesterase class I)